MVIYICFLSLFSLLPVPRQEPNWVKGGNKKERVKQFARCQTPTFHHWSLLRKKVHPLIALLSLEVLCPPSRERRRQVFSLRREQLDLEICHWRMITRGYEGEMRKVVPTCISRVDVSDFSLLKSKELEQVQMPFSPLIKRLQVLCSTLCSWFTCSSS